MGRKPPNDDIMKMKISVIIPCHNLESYIEKCLASIAEQSLNKAEYEVIVVFDSCTDASEEIAKKVLSRVGMAYKFFDTNKRRAGLARNVGLQNAMGEYIYFMDGDDFLVDKNALEKLLNAAKTNATAAVYQKNFESDTAVCDVDAVWRYFIKRDFIGDERFSSLEINEDWEFILNLKNRKNYSECFVDDVMYHYTYPREKSITDKYRKMHPEVFNF